MQDFRWLEYFAGQASCTFEMRQAGFRSARFDKLYCQDPGAHGRKTNWMDLTTPAGFALAVVFVMKGMELDLLSWFGIKCSSLVAVNSGTSKRSACNSIGLSCPSVDESNTLLERTICLCMLVTAKQGVWVLEQPGSSVLEFYPAWLHFLNALYQWYGMKSVRRVAWWMSRYGAKSPKRQYAWANSPAILRLDVGWKKMKHTIRTCHQYVNKNGKRCWHGSSQLKRTENYPRPFAQAIVRLRDDLVNRGTRHSYPSPMPTGVSTVQAAWQDDEGLFKQARLSEVIAYLRLGSSLNLPKHWRETIPRPDGF